MQWLVLFFLLVSNLVWAEGCKYLELRIPGRVSDSLLNDVPIYLAYPDSLGFLAVRPFLEAPDSTARALLKPSDWQKQPLQKHEKLFLQALRNFMGGNVREAGAAIGSLTLPTTTTGVDLRPYLKINRGLLLLLNGFPADAEKTWLQAYKRGQKVGDESEGFGNTQQSKSCAEGAWRNLYSFYLGRKDFKKAHGLVEEALLTSPKNKWANFAKGYLLHMLAPRDDLKLFLQQKSSWKDSLFEIQIAYGKFLKEQGQLSEAAKYYSRGLEGAPKNGPAWLELADIYYRQGLLVFSETCIHEAFKFGINDPYIFELYSLVLQAVSEKAEGSTQRWNGAEKLLEQGFPHDLHSRSMAQLLYHVYCHNQKVDAANNLRDEFWFHFVGPRQERRREISSTPLPPKIGLKIRLSEISFPLIRALENTDFFDPF